MGKCPYRGERWHCTKRKNPFTGELNDCVGTDNCSYWPTIQKDQRIAELQAELEDAKMRHRIQNKIQFELEAELEAVKKTCKAVSQCHDIEREHNAELAEEIAVLEAELALNKKTIQVLAEYLVSTELKMFGKAPIIRPWMIAHKIQMATAKAKEQGQ